MADAPAQDILVQLGTDGSFFGIRGPAAAVLSWSLVATSVVLGSVVSYGLAYTDTVEQTSVSVWGKILVGSLSYANAFISSVLALHVAVNLQPWKMFTVEAIVAGSAVVCSIQYILSMKAQERHLLNAWIGAATMVVGNRVEAGTARAALEGIRRVDEGHVTSAADLEGRGRALGAVIYDKPPRISRFSFSPFSPFSTAFRMWRRVGSTSNLPRVSVRTEGGRWKRVAKYTHHFSMLRAYADAERAARPNGAYEDSDSTGKLVVYTRLVGPVRQVVNSKCGDLWLSANGYPMVIRSAPEWQIVGSEIAVSLLEGLALIDNVQYGGVENMIAMRIWAESVGLGWRMERQELACVCWALEDFGMDTSGTKIKLKGLSEDVWKDLEDEERRAYARGNFVAALGLVGMRSIFALERNVQIKGIRIIEDALQQDAALRGETLVSIAPNGTKSCAVGVERTPDLVEHMMRGVVNMYNDCAIESGAPPLPWDIAQYTWSGYLSEISSELHLVHT